MNEIKRVLIADDDSTLRLLMREALESDGFDVVEASDGAQALSVFETSKPQPVLVIADLMMPGTDGFALCRELKKSAAGRHIPIMVVTALEDIESVAQAYEAGATDFITKPLNWMIFANRVRYILRANAAFEALYEKQEQLKLLEAIATASNNVDTISDVLRFTLAQICSFTGWPVGIAYCRDSAQKHLNYTFVVPTTRARRHATFCTEIEIAKIAPSGCLPERVWETGKAAWAHDLSADPSSPRAAAAAAAGLKGAFAFPVFAGGDAGVVLEFLSDHVLPADHAFFQLSGQIGAQISRVLERDQAQRRLVHSATHDALTGLPNRVLLLDRLKRAVMMRQRYRDYQFALLYIDLDGFKIVNDGLGHPIGDRLLVEVGDRLRSLQRTVDLVARPDVASETEMLARLGGDEFTLLLDDIRHASDAIRVSERIHDALRTPFLVDGSEIHVSASIGIATSETNYVSADDLLRDADLAMYRAKSLGKARSEVFDQTMYSNALRRLQLENELRSALERRQFLLHYQPIVSLTTGEIEGFEALLRWRKPNGELVYPDDFIAIAEDTELILNIGIWVLREACRTVSQWNRSFRPNNPLRICVNLSARQFTQPDLVSQVHKIFEETEIDPKVVTLEITESVAMNDGERASRVLNELRNIGVKTSLDDFGTGFSSLSYLHRFPIDTLKIDRSFISQVDRGREGLQIVKTIIELARNLEMNIVAEGTETDAHIVHLRSLGCDYGQGFFFSRPVDAATACNMIKDEGSLRAGWGK